MPEINETNVQGIEASQSDSLRWLATSAELPATGADGDAFIIGTTDTVWTWDTDTVAWVDSGIPPAAPVTSVFGRVGAIVAAASDYDASQIDNDSTAPGAFVDDALTGHETRVAANDAKVSNATHTGEVTGSGALAIDKTAITGKSSVTAAATDEVLIADADDTGNLKKVTAQSIADLAGGGVQLDRFNALDALLVGSAIPVFESRNGHPVLSFDDSTDEEVVFNSIMSNDYADGNLTVDIDWVSASAITGDVKWDVAFERIPGQDIDSDGFAAIQTDTDTTNGTSGVVTRTSIAFTQAQADSIAAGEAYRLKVTRDTSVGGDMVGDTQLLRVTLRQ